MVAGRPPDPPTGPPSSIVDPATDDLADALPGGILFLDGTLDPADLRDGLGHPAAGPLHTAWVEHGPRIDTKRTDLRDWLRLELFGSVHRPMYENRPIHWPLSSDGRTFVAWVTIHRWTADTLRVLLADHLGPAQKRLLGERDDLSAARQGPDAKAANRAERRYAKVVKALGEVERFMDAVQQCAERGPDAPPGSKAPAREVDARYAPDLDDGVMINAAALWPVLDPQWKDPRKWWVDLATGEGRKDCDWAHLAMRTWPSRVDAKCRVDPSLGVAHGCFWAYHPGKAWAWELRLQHEIGPDFRIEEGPYRGDGGHEVKRAAYLRDHPDEALEAVEKEARRRIRALAKASAEPDPDGDEGSPAPDDEDAGPGGVLGELRLLEPGLWSARPRACWELEVRVEKAQGAPFVLRAPDEASARAGLLDEHPELADERVGVQLALTSVREER